MLDLIADLDKPAAWLVAVVAGLGALGWLAKKTWRAFKRARRFWREVAKPLARKAEVVIRLAEYELQHNGGGSLKDMAAQIPTITVNMQRLNDQWSTHLKQAEGRDTAIAEVREAQEGFKGALEDVQETVTYLAEHLPPQDDDPH